MLGKMTCGGGEKPAVKDKENCNAVFKETGYARMMLKKYCYDPKSYGCQEQRKNLDVAVAKQKMSGCE